MNSKNNIDYYLDQIQQYLKKQNLDYYDVRLEKTSSNFINIQNKYIKEVKDDSSIGVGIRILKNKKLGFCSTTNLSNYKQLIDDCINSTKNLSKKTNLDNFSKNKDKVKHKHKKFESIDLDIKAKDLFKLNKEKLKSNSNILQSDITYLERYCEKYFVSPYANIYQEEPYIVMYSTMTAKKDDVVETSMGRSADFGGLEKLSYSKQDKVLNETIVNVNKLLNSKPCPALKTDILITPEISELLAHEAIGHAAEADAVINNESILKLKQKLTSNKNINIIDDPTIKEFGHYKYDDEGIKGRKKTLVKNGVVNEYLLDIETATKLKTKSNGSGRAESYNKLPIVRMSNTYFDVGKDKYKDVLSDFTGYVLDGFAGGQVDPSVGTFMFGIKFATKYKNGKEVGKFKQASISGNILDYLKNITTVTNKLGKYSPGFCGKGGQRAFVSGTGPYLKINNVVVGGTKHE